MFVVYIYNVYVLHVCEDGCYMPGPEHSPPGMSTGIDISYLVMNAKFIHFFSRKRVYSCCELVGQVTYVIKISCTELLY